MAPAARARFAGKRIAVIGGNAGIGLAAARQFAAEGAALAVTGRNPATLEAAANECRAWSRAVDLADLTAMRVALADMHAALGGLDVLFLNAGVGGFAAIDAVSEAFWDEVHNVNLKGAFFALQAALPLLSEGGSVVVTGSIGSMTAVPGNVVYAAAKAGLRAVVRIAAVEAVPRRIRVNMVSPGPTDTEIFKRGAEADEIERMRAFLGSVVPLGRMGTPEEIAHAALFLASDEASFITGIDLIADGGCVELRH